MVGGVSLRYCGGVWQRWRRNVVRGREFNESVFSACGGRCALKSY